MAELNLTLNMDELIEAVYSSDMDKIMKSMAVTIFNAAMLAERDDYLRAKPYERTEERQDYRNGTYSRNLTTKIGTIELKVPRTRSNGYETELFDKYQRMDQALVVCMAEMYVNGVSTRKITNVVETLFGKKVSKSLVSSFNKHLDPAVFEFKGRSLTHTNFRYIYVDAMYIKVRENHRSVSKAVYIAQGINDKNKCEIIGVMISDGESEANWSNFFVDLKARGLTTPKLIISDAHSGLKAAIRKEFLGSVWQRCTVHFLRNILAHFPKKGSDNERQLLKKIFRTRTQQEAREMKAAFEAEVAGDKRYDKALAILEEGFEDAIPYLLEPESYHISLRTTNSLERINREIRRRERVINLFPNCEAAERLIVSVLIDIHEKWEESSYTFLKEFIG